MGSYTAHRMTDKITELYDGIYVCRSGSSADTQTLTGYARNHLRELSYATFWLAASTSMSWFIRYWIGKRPSVEQAAHTLRSLTYNNKDYLEGNHSLTLFYLLCHDSLIASFLCAGLDGDKPRVFAIPLGGSIIEQPRFGASGITLS